jgi:hypothetical protein
MLSKLFSQDAADWLSSMLVVLSGGLTGHYAAAGMNALQWAGAITAVLGSVTVAVAIRVWPAPQGAGAQSRED